LKRAAPRANGSSRRRALNRRAFRRSGQAGRSGRRLAAVEKTRAEVAGIIASGKAQLGAERDVMMSRGAPRRAELHRRAPRKK